ncbi:LuxR C-terminal-related transcriptional regulator [Nonomuraea sp. H19]|uniref:LuxR C-terminal-related transcriptional regulator n=1 Tax=Nonomuraea sp. H19 TaxID=3452206 RepID=UPI003F8CD713
MRPLWPFAGRASQLAAIQSAMEAGGAVLAGPAGVGKSRLAAEAVRDANGVARVLATAAASGVPLGAMAHLLPARPPGGNVLRWAADAVAGEHRVLLVDDAHLLDAVSAALVHHLVAGGQARVLVTVRAGERAPDAVTALWKDDLLPRLDLDPLTADEAGQILAATLGGQVEAATVRRLWRVSDGNALFLRELVLAGEAGGGLVERRGIWRWQGEIPVTTRLRELIESRIGDISAEERAVLELIAYGEPLSAAALTALSSPLTVRRLEDRQLVTVSGQDLSVRLAHPLYGEVIRAGCGALRRREVLTWLADAAEQAGPPTAEKLLRIAVWRLDGGTADDPDLLIRACHIARNVRDLELAARLGRAALAAGGGIAAGLPLATVLNYADRFEEAGEVLRCLAGEPMDDPVRAEYEAVRALNLFWGFGREEEARAALTAAAAAMTDRGSRQGVLIIRTSIEHLMGRFAQARTTMEQIRGIGPSGTRVSVGLAAMESFVLAHEGRGRQAMALVDEALDRIGRLPDGLPSIQAALAEAGAFAAMVAGDLTAAERYAGIGYRIGEDYAGWDRALVTFGAWRARTCRLRGRMSEAIRMGRQAAVRLRGRTLHAGLCLAELGQAYALTGDLPAMRATLRLADEFVLRVGHLPEFAFLLVRPWTLAAEGDVAGGIEAALETADAARDLPAYELFALYDVVRLGAGGRVADRLTALARTFEGELAPVFARHARAALAGDAGELEAVSLSLESLGLPLAAAEAAAQAAAAYRGDGLRRAQRAAETRAWMLARQCEDAHTPALTGLAAPQLTPRQRQIAHLAAAGLSNPDIADRLVLSRRTVANTLVQVYERTGISGRDELAKILHLPEPG